MSNEENEAKVYALLVIGTIANILNLIYNVPQIILTCKRKTTNDISGAFLLLRTLASVLWVLYAFIELDIQYILANLVSLVSSLILDYFKVLQLWKEWKAKREKDEKYVILSQV